MSDDLSLEALVEFAENPEPRCPCVLLLDVSASMKGEPLRRLQEGLALLREELRADELAARRVEIALVTFDSQVEVRSDFVTPDRLELPTLTAQGLTHLGGAVLRGLDLLRARKELYKQSGVAYYRPWLFLLTDGEPQGEPEELFARARERVRAEERARRVAFFAVGTQSANLAKLRELATREPLRLQGLRFAEMFVWLSASMQAVSRSQIDDEVKLPPPGWGAP